MKKGKLKNSRAAEARKIDLAVKYQSEGKATGGGRQHPRKVRKTMEARNVPVGRTARGISRAK
jgi:hypothetical protein